MVNGKWSTVYGQQLRNRWAVIGAGVLRGSGRQHIGAYVNLVAYYVIAIPVGCLATFYFDFGVQVRAVSTLGAATALFPLIDIFEISIEILIEAVCAITVRPLCSHFILLEASHLLMFVSCIIFRRL